MVSLKKEPQIREVTPVHLMDEEEAVRIYCPPRDEIKISVKQADIDLLPAIKDNAKPQEINNNDTPQEHTFGGLNKWEGAEIIIKSIAIMGGLAFVVFFLSSFLGEGLTLAKYLATH